MKDNRPPKEERTLKKGDIGSDGMVFWGYHPGTKNGEEWVSETDYLRKREMVKRNRRDNRPPKDERTLKRGYIREDGMVFCGYRKRAKNGEEWVSEADYLRRNGRDNRPPKDERTLKHGDVREDGMVFWRYSAGAKNGEVWKTPESFDESKNKLQDSDADYKLKNREKMLERGRKYYRKNRDKLTKQSREYQKNNRDRINEYRKKKRDSDSSYRLLINMRSRLYQAIKSGRGTKSLKTKELIGCSVEDLKRHLESQFTEGMTWENYGEWHVDHIKPCASFDLTIDNEQKGCFHYSNLQPLWAKDNQMKGADIQACYNILKTATERNTLRKGK